MGRVANGQSKSPRLYLAIARALAGEFVERVFGNQEAEHFVNNKMVYPNDELKEWGTSKSASGTTRAMMAYAWVMPCLRYSGQIKRLRRGVYAFTAAGIKALNGDDQDVHDAWARGWEEHELNSAPVEEDSEVVVAPAVSIETEVIEQLAQVAEKNFRTPTQQLRYLLSITA